MSDMLNDRFHRTAKDVLGMWLDIDEKNLLRMKAGMYSFTMPDGYKTNDMEVRGKVTQGIARLPNESLPPSVEHLKEILGWLPDKLRRNDDFTGMVLGAMLLRYLGDDHPDAFVQQAINKAVGMENSYLFAGVDELLKMVRERIGAADTTPDV